jgi:hypothetical protein
MSYEEIGLSLSSAQKIKIAKAIKMQQPVTIRLSPNQYNGVDKLNLTKYQIVKLMKHKQLKSGVDIKLSVTQLKKQQGGWIGSLLASLAGSLLPGLFGKGLKKRTAKGLFLPGTIR